MIQDKLLEKITLVGIFLVPIIPLIISDFLFFPYITGKNFLFRIIVEIIFSAWLIWALKEPKVRPKKSILLTVVALFVLAMITSAIVGENTFKSFWSNYERMEGVVGYIHVFAYLFVLACTFTKKRFQTYLHTILGVAIAVAVYGWLQHLGVFLTSQDPNRVDATLGNPIYMAAYMLLCFFISLILFYYPDREENYKNVKNTVLIAVNFIAVYLIAILGKAADSSTGKLFIFISACVAVDVLYLFFKNKIEENRSRFLAIVYALWAALFLYVLFLTQTRGAVIGLVCSLIYTALYLVIFDKGKSRKMAIGVIASILLIIAVFISIRNTSFVQDNKTLARLSRISLKEPTSTSRIWIWQIALEGFKENPILGWGNENYNLVFNKYYKPELVSSEQWFDRSHNIMLDWLVNTGLLGLGLYLALFGSAIFYLFKRDSSFSIKEKAVLSGALVGYLIQNIFVFDNISGIVIFVSILAYIYVRNFENNKDIGTGQNQSFINLAMIIVVLSLLSSLYYINYRPIKVAYMLNQANVLSANGDFAGAFNLYKKAISLGTFGLGETREHLLMSSQRAFDNKNTTKDLNQAYFEEGIKEMQLQIKEAPKDLRNYVLYGSYLKHYGIYEQAVAVLEQAKKMSPKKQAVYHMLADIYVNKGDLDKAINEVRTAYEFYPKASEPAVMLALVYMIAGDKKSADATLIDTFNTLYYYDPRLVNIYTNNKDYERLEGVWKKFALDNPNDPLGFSSLYDLYTNEGKKDLAKNALESEIFINEKLLALDPNNINKIISLFNLYMADNDLTKARIAIQRAASTTESYIKKHSEDYTAHISLSSFYLILGQKEEAIKVLQQALKNPNSPKDEINGYISEIAAGKNPWAK